VVFDGDNDGTTGTTARHRKVEEVPLLDVKDKAGKQRKKGLKKIQSRVSQ
jgi:hypothetical protein